MADLAKLLGKESEDLLEHTCKTVPKDQLHLPGPDFIDRVLVISDRPIQVLRNMRAVFDHGRLAGTGYLSILPVDQGIEHSAGASFAPNPIYFDPENIVKLAAEGSCNAVASTLGVLGSVARKWAHRIPFIVKINHNELLTYPSTYDQVLRLYSAQLRKNPQEGVFRAEQRPPNRSDPLSGGELLHGKGRADQLRRGFRGQRFGPGRADCGDQQACRRNRAHLGSQGLPKADEGRGRAAQHDSGDLSGQIGHSSLI